MLAFDRPVAQRSTGTCQRVVLPHCPTSCTKGGGTKRLGGSAR